MSKIYKMLGRSQKVPFQNIKETFHIIKKHEW